MKKLLILFIILMTSNLAEAQFIKEKSITAQIGYGITFPYNSIDDVASGGFFMQGEYVLKVYSWLDLKPYSGFVITNSDGKDLDNNPTSEFAETTAFMFGGKIRLRAPIPYVAPYIEFGFGASLGRFETFTAFTDVNHSGFTYHIPIAFGLELGKNHSVDLGFAYYAQPNVDQVVGVLVLGIAIPLKKKK